MAAIIKQSFIEAWSAGHRDQRSDREEEARRKLKDLFEHRRLRARASDEDEKTMPKPIAEDAG